jgi:hypothetical protein
MSLRLISAGHKVARRKECTVYWSHGGVGSVAQQEACVCVHSICCRSFKCQMIRTKYLKALMYSFRINFPEGLIQESWCYEYRYEGDTPTQIVRKIRRRNAVSLDP